MLNAEQLEKRIDWGKLDGLVPAIVQDAFDGRVLMLGYMSCASLEKTFTSGLVTFYSRTRQCLWTKGETSGNHLELVSIDIDCDNDCLLVRARPQGPTCHRGTSTCFDAEHAVMPELGVLAQLERLIQQREQQRPKGSYTTSLFESGVKRIAQKVGEEGVETALAAIGGDDDELLNESADLLYHLLVLLRSRALDLRQVMAQLAARHA